MKRLPNSSNDSVGSQHASPSASPAVPSPINVLVHVEPPSKLTALNMPAVSPASRWPMLVTMTMLLGFVGLIAIASSDSFKWRWLTSTFVGIPAAGAPPGGRGGRGGGGKKKGALSRGTEITP